MILELELLNKIQIEPEVPEHRLILADYWEEQGLAKGEQLREATEQKIPYVPPMQASAAEVWAALNYASSLNQAVVIVIRHPQVKGGKATTAETLFEIIIQDYQTYKAVKATFSAAAAIALVEYRKQFRVSDLSTYANLSNLLASWKDRVTYNVTFSNSPPQAVIYVNQTYVADTPDEYQRFFRALTNGFREVYCYLNMEHRQYEITVDLSDVTV